MLKEAYKYLREQVFTLSDSNREKGSFYNLKEGRLQLNIRIFFIYIISLYLSIFILYLYIIIYIFILYLLEILYSEGSRHWNRLPREVLAILSLGMFKVRLDGSPGEDGRMATLLMSRGLEQGSISNPSQSMILFLYECKYQNNIPLT